MSANNKGYLRLLILLIFSKEFFSSVKFSRFERIKTDEQTSFDIDSYAHYLHHKYFECNYADGILPLDRWFGTLHDGSEESFNKMRARLSKKNQGEFSAKT